MHTTLPPAKSLGRGLVHTGRPLGAPELFPTDKSCLFELADLGGILQVVVVKRGSHPFPVGLPDSQLAGLFIPTRDYLPTWPTVARARFAVSLK